MRMISQAPAQVSNGTEEFKKTKSGETKEKERWCCLRYIATAN